MWRLSDDLFQTAETAVCSKIQRKRCPCGVSVLIIRIYLLSGRLLADSTADLVHRPVGRSYLPTYYLPTYLPVRQRSG